MIQFTDALYGTIGIPDRHVDILNTKALSRLRNIKQLGYTVARYPGAVHTRLEHTLGTVSVARGLIEALDENVTKPASSKMITAALLSEIGSTPLSFSTRRIFNDIGLSSSIIAKTLLDYELMKFPGVHAWREESQTTGCAFERWDVLMSRAPGFYDLGLIRTASMLDYVRRDSHYCGQLTPSFELDAFFETVNQALHGGAIDDLIDLLRVLHRSAFSLNKMYADRDRRVLAVLLRRLSEHLIDAGTLNLAIYKRPEYLVELDDDAFIADLVAAVENSTKNDDMYKLFEHVYNLRESTFISLDSFGLSEVTDAARIESEVARKLCVSRDLVVAIGWDIVDGNGFRMFGHEYSCAKEAVRNDLFSLRTGLDSEKISSCAPGYGAVAVIK